MVATALGGPEVLELRDVAEPVPGPGEVLIRVHRAGINFADISSLKGAYAQAPKPPFTPGLEVSGHEAAGGRPVAAIVASGGYADLVVADSRMVWDARGLDLDEVAGWPLVTQTAYHALAHMARLSGGETVLITAAAGGLGSALVMTARALGAGTVVGIASTDAKRRQVLALGADAAVGYGDAVPAADVLVDTVGGDGFPRLLEALRPFGRAVLLGSTSGSVQEIPGVGSLRLRGIGVMPFSLGAYRAAHADAFARTAAAGWDLARSGAVRPPVGSVWPLGDAPRALEALASRATSGKLLLSVGG